MPRHQTPSTRTGPQDSAGPVRPAPRHAWAHEVRGGPSLRSDGLSSSPQEPLTLQPEAMLLWLTLALLWSPTYWAGGKSGLGSPLPIPLEAPPLPSLRPGLPGPVQPAARLLGARGPAEGREARPRRGASEPEPEGQARAGVLCCLNLLLRSHRLLELNYHADPPKGTWD